MPKTVSPSKFTELKGLDRISSTIHEMKCLFREITKDDYGIDGELEVVVAKADGKGFETTGGIIKVQSKSGESYVKQDTTASFCTPVNKDDLETWYAATHPVIFIVFHPKDDKLYWKDVRAYVRSAPDVWQPPLKIVFDKSKDEFTPSAYDSVRELATVSPPRISREQKERLYSNLLLVKRLPSIITSAATPSMNYSTIRSQLHGPVPPFCIVEGRLYTLADLRRPDCVLRDFCDLSRIDDVPAERWIKDEVRRRDFVFLLNQLLGVHLNSCGLRYNRDFQRNYFPRQNLDDLVFRQDWFNVRTGREAPARIIAKYYTYGIDKFWRHLAVKLAFEVYGATWYLQVVPKYFFTYDGHVAYDRDKTGPYTTKLKARERNVHVLNHVLFWADVLSLQRPSIEFKLDDTTVLVIEKTPVSGTADFAITYDPVIYEDADESSGQLEMFDLQGDDSDDNELEDADDEY